MSNAYRESRSNEAIVGLAVQSCTGAEIEVGVASVDDDEVGGLVVRGSAGAMAGMHADMFGVGNEPGGQLVTEIKRQAGLKKTTGDFGRQEKVAFDLIESLGCFGGV